MPDCHPVSLAWKASQLNVDSIRKLRGSIMPLAYAFTGLTRVSEYKQALADVRSTGAGIRYLYCTLKDFAQRAILMAVELLSHRRRGWVNIWIDNPIITIQYMYNHLMSDQETTASKLVLPKSLDINRLPPKKRILNIVKFSTLL